MTIQIQPVEAADMEAFLDVCGELYAFDGASPYDRDQTRPAAQQLLDSPQLGRAVWLLADGQRAGYLILCYGWSFEFGGRTAILEHLFVRESFRRQGIADAALEWAETHCRDEGVGSVYLGVEGSNERAQHLYRKRGYQDPNLFFWVKSLD